MPIKILQTGLGPLGINIAQKIAARPGLETVAAMDIDPALRGKDLGTLCGHTASGVLITDDLAEAVKISGPDVAVITTVSDLDGIAPLLKRVLELELPVVSTCEELSYPWQNAPENADEINTLAKEKGVAVVGTGVNPGFLMDALPTFLTAVCHEVDHIRVERYQDARYRRIPFQRKIGVGLSEEEFQARKQAGTLRHVGLTESMRFIASRMGWNLDKTEDVISPIRSATAVTHGSTTLQPGQIAGVRQVGRAFVNGEEKIELIFQAAFGERESFDAITIKGMPSINSRIPGGVHGDLATAAITINTIPRILEAQPGLKTMLDIPMVSYFG